MGRIGKAEGGIKRMKFWALTITPREHLGAQQVAEKVAAHRLLKNVQIKGSSFDKLRINSPEERGVRASTPQ
jgi:hypothetical protein